MRHIGNVSDGLRKCCARIRRLSMENGEICVFGDAAGNLTFIGHYDTNYRAAMHRLAAAIVGVYRDFIPGGRNSDDPNDHVYRSCMDDLMHVYKLPPPAVGAP